MKHVFKKMIISGLTLAMVLGGTTSAFAKGHEDGGNNEGNGKAKIQIKMDFKDIDDSEGWARINIASLASKRVFDGYDDGTFQPKKSISRIEAIIAAVRLMGLRDKAESPAEMTAHLNFSDADKIAMRYPNALGYVAVAVENDLFSETDKAVMPDKAADRLWATTLLVKALKLDAEAKTKMNTQLPFYDANQIPAGSVGYVAEALDKKLIFGYENNTFRPNQPVTRAELAALLDRTGDQLPDQGNGTIRGTVTVATAANVLTIVKDGQTVQLTLDSNAFIYRSGVKVTAADIKVGDQIIARSFNSAVIFIQVTKNVDATVPPVVTPPTTFKVDGTISAVTIGANNKIATISLNQVVNGVTQVTIYNVSPTATLTGIAAPLIANQAVELKGSNQLVTSIEVK